MPVLPGTYYPDSPSNAASPGTQISRGRNAATARSSSDEMRKLLSEMSVLMPQPVFSSVAIVVLFLVRLKRRARASSGQSVVDGPGNMGAAGGGGGVSKIFFPPFAVGAPLRTGITSGAGPVQPRGDGVPSPPLAAVSSSAGNGVNGVERMPALIAPQTVILPSHALPPPRRKATHWGMSLSPPSAPLASAASLGPQGVPSQLPLSSHFARPADGPRPVPTSSLSPNPPAVSSNGNGPLHIIPNHGVPSPWGPVVGVGAAGMRLGVGGDIPPANLL
jgi:hypothetical protein